MNTNPYRRHQLPTLSGLQERKLEVWLPSQYFEQPDARFPVLYMHDGQNLFKPRPRVYPGWLVAESISTLTAKNALTPPLVVGLWNTSNRLGDYLPAKPVQTDAGRAFLKAYLRNAHRRVKQVSSDLYLRWIVEVVKPFIDANYRTHSGASQTCLMGSSMGGLISLYAVCEYPQVFGGAGCLSTHWPICGDPFLEYLEEKLPASAEHKLYFDRGTESLDAKYVPWQTEMDALALRHTYTPGINYLSLVFPGESHHERFWAGRLHIPLTFLFGSSAESTAWAQ
ncbi:MAG: alpha/beta hydrolase [Anaerolineaceae bacterium]